MHRSDCETCSLLVCTVFLMSFRQSSRRFEFSSLWIHVISRYIFKLLDGDEPQTRKGAFVCNLPILTFSYVQLANSSCKRMSTHTFWVTLRLGSVVSLRCCFHISMGVIKLPKCHLYMNMFRLFGRTPHLSSQSADAHTHSICFEWAKKGKRGKERERKNRAK